MGNSWNWKQSFAFFLLFVPAIIVYALHNRGPEFVHGTFLQTPAHWIQQAYDEVTYKINETMNTYFYLVNINRHNKQLIIQNGQLASKIQLLEEYRNENIRLRALFKFQQELPRQTLPARIISKDILSQSDSLDSKSITIDKGTNHGVKRLQGVISSNGVVGYTIEVEAESSRVLLMSNHNANIDALVQRTRARGIVSGLTTQTYQLKYMMRQEDTQPGDIIVTSGRQGYFPKGFNIGTVTHVSMSPTGVSYEAKISPSVKLDRLEQVLVIVENQESGKKE